MYYAFLGRVSKGWKDSELRVKEWSKDSEGIVNCKHAWQPNVIFLWYNPQG